VVKYPQNHIGDEGIFMMGMKDSQLLEESLPFVTKPGRYIGRERKLKQNKFTSDSVSIGRYMRGDLNE